MPVICQNCEYVGITKYRGSGGMELACWLVFLPLGILYSVWRRSKSKCPICNSSDLLPITSPKAERLLVSSEALKNRVGMAIKAEGLTQEAQSKKDRIIWKTIWISAGLIFLFSMVGMLFSS